MEGNERRSPNDNRKRAPRHRQIPEGRSPNFRETGRGFLPKDEVLDAGSTQPEPFGDRNVFQDHYPNGQLEVNESIVLPPQVESFFSERGYGQTDSDQTGIITHADGTKTYLFVNPHQVIFPGYELEVTCLVDADQEGQLMGKGVLSLRKNTDKPFYLDKPFCNYTFTEAGHRGEGLGTRRLEVMNALAHSIYNGPIYSDYDTSSDQIRIWKKLVAGGKAQSFTDESVTGERVKRFVFTE